ncbi:NADPH-dependent FMN reductase [Sulfobacillus harzensis]|uniref:NAD(P)H-dependent oxidoreductase n=1 Tax=Sulfobacillus harzensis TaxID=2729629 RepID=A0A7Y0L7P3_9FIRM|nr:NAD(P)H-dependent oxidoreductase [Sulfobacillus harzensis]NMP24730.1 NAD(P)H-dependent oxidoreductase [Sulfobacillus harzensis]
MLKIGVILGSTRDNRLGGKAARWLMDQAVQRTDLQFELIDLRDYTLPFFNERASNMHVPTQDAEGLRWQKKIAEFDGYVIMAAEYNHGPTAALKNALDYAYVEWVRKPVAFVGYGSVGAARAIEQLRLIAVELQMAPIRSAVHIQGGDFLPILMGQKTFDDLAHLQPLVSTMFDDLAWWTNALKVARER